MKLFTSHLRINLTDLFVIRINRAQLWNIHVISGARRLCLKTEWWFRKKYSLSFQKLVPKFTSSPLRNWILESRGIISARESERERPDERIDVTSCHLNPRLAPTRPSYGRWIISEQTSGSPWFGPPLSSSPWRSPVPPLSARVRSWSHRCLGPPAWKFLSMNRYTTHAPNPSPITPLLCMFARACAHKRSRASVCTARAITHMQMHR